MRADKKEDIIVNARALMVMLIIAIFGLVVYVQVNVCTHFSWVNILIELKGYFKSLCNQAKNKALPKKEPTVKDNKKVKLHQSHKIFE